MALGKATLVLCLGFLAVQALNIEEQSRAAQLSGAAEVAEGLLKQLEKVVQDAIDAALKTLGGFLKEIASAAEEFEQTLNATLVAACKPFIEAIEAAVATAAKAGVDVVDCVGTSKDDILDLPAQLLRNVTSCVTSKVNEANGIINNFTNEVNSTINIVLGIGNQVQDCEDGNILVLPLCLAGVTANITEQMVSIPIKITKDVTQANLYVIGFLPSLTVCDFGAKAALILRAGGIAGSVTSCIAKKLVNSNGTTSANSPTTAAPASSNSSTAANFVYLN